VIRQTHGIKFSIFPIETDQSSIESGRVELFGPIENGQASIDPEAIDLFKPPE